MTSEQRKAHKRFILSVKARAIDSMGAPQSPSAKPRANQVSKRSRLRLGECVVFLPSRRPDSDGSWFAVPRHTDNLAADGTEATSLITQLDVSLAETCLLVHATTRHIALHPLSSTRYPRITASLSSSTGGQSMLISPIGHRVELVDIMPLGSIAHDHLPELRSIFARLNDAEPSKSSDDDATFASGFAICVLSSIGPSSQSDHAQLQQPQVAAFAGFPQSDTDNQDRSQLNMDVEHNHSSRSQSHADSCGQSKWLCCSSESVIDINACSWLWTPTQHRPAYHAKSAHDAAEGTCSVHTQSAQRSQRGSSCARNGTLYAW